MEPKFFSHRNQIGFTWKSEIRKLPRRFFPNELSLKISISQDISFSDFYIIFVKQKRLFNIFQMLWNRVSWAPGSRKRKHIRSVPKAKASFQKQWFKAFLYVVLHIVSECRIMFHILHIQGGLDARIPCQTCLIWKWEFVKGIILTMKGKNKISRDQKYKIRQEYAADVFTQIVNRIGENFDFTQILIIWRHIINIYVKELFLEIKFIKLSCFRAFRWHADSQPDYYNYLLITSKFWKK